MKLGFTIPHNVQFASLELIDRVIDVSESGGWDSLWVQDHVGLPKVFTSTYPYGAAGARRYATGGHVASEGAPKPSPLPWWDSTAVMAYAAARTSRVDLGFSVLVIPLRPPLVTAKLLATLDALSNGRVICGIGVGWLEDEFRELGIGHLWAKRGEVTNEALDVMMRVWSEDYASFEGKYSSFHDLSITPKPVQTPHIPFWVGGNGRVAIKRTAAYGHGWQPVSALPEEIVEGRQRLDTELRERGRDPEEITVCVRRRLAVYPPGGHSVEAEADPKSYFAGTPEEIVRSLNEYAAAGVDHVILDPWAVGSPEEGLAMLDEVAKEIQPAVQSV